MKKIINLPHLTYQVYFYTGKDIPKNCSNEGSIAWTVKGENSSAVCIREKIDAQPTLLAHEIMHVLQFLAHERNMDFLQEQEHFAYLMQFLLAEMLGVKLYSKKAK